MFTNETRITANGGRSYERLNAGHKGNPQLPPHFATAPPNKMQIGAGT